MSHSEQKMTKRERVRERKKVRDWERERKKKRDMVRDSEQDRGWEREREGGKY